MERVQLKPNDLDLYVAYGGRDEFNIDTQVESFLHRAKELGIPVQVDFDLRGKHDLSSGERHFAESIRWIAPQRRALEALDSPLASP